MWFSFLAASLAGCGDPLPGPAPADRPPLPSGRLVDGCFMAEGAPDPTACQAAADCAAGGLLQPSTCCLGGETHPHAAAWHAWQTALFERHCDPTCRVPPSPPLDCELDLRCEEGRCRNACDQPAGG